MTEKSQELDELDSIAEYLRELQGGRNLRTETAQLRGRYLSGWMDLELNLDELITEYLEVPDGKRDDMTDGLLPAITSVNAKVEFLKIIVQRVDPSSEAYSLTQKAQLTRNALAHRAAGWAEVSPEVQAGAVPVVDYKHGRRRVTYIQPNEALRGLRAAAEAIFQLTVMARPDYVDRLKARALSGMGRNGTP
jgi:hypothetical protein